VVVGCRPRTAPAWIGASVPTTWSSSTSFLPMWLSSSGPDWALGDRPELEPLRCGPGRTCWVRGHWSTKNRRYSTTSTVLRRGRVDLLRVIAFRARVWRPATHKADLDGLRIHELRHTAVALWIAAGAGPKEAAARAGHS